MKILWIAFVWPEPVSSAAGVRTTQLVRACVAEGFEVRMASPCQSNAFREDLDVAGVTTARYEANDSDFDAYVKEFNPDIVIFDRFIMEEQFGWRVRQNCPDAVRIVDTIDLHFLRRTREKKIKQGFETLLLSDADLHTDDAVREVAAIFRSDKSLLVSDAEYNLLKDRYHIPTELFDVCRIFYDKPSKALGFDTRKNLAMIGNFNHAPNLDGYHLLQKELWAGIRGRLAEKGIHDAELHIYGAYPSNDFMKFDDPKTGFRVKGWTENATETLSHYRVNLAPLRFGAGIKGKISDGWSVGTPCIATSIAAEGMHENLAFGGYIADEWGAFAEQAAMLHSSIETWKQAQQAGLEIITQLYNREGVLSMFLKILAESVQTRESGRDKNFIGTMLWHQIHRSTEYFSRWIEAKNKK